MKEAWRSIAGYEGLYEISSRGQVKSLARILHTPHPRCRQLRKLPIPEKILVPGVDKNGYHLNGLTKERKRRTHKIHRLVAQAFIPNPSNYPQVNHIDGNKQNNNVDNLEWCTCSMNIRHGYRTGLKNQDGEKNHQSKLRSSDVIKIRDLVQGGSMTHKDIGAIFNVSESRISAIKLKKAWAHT